MKFGLIGHPIGHSLSPALFKAAFGGKYTYDLIQEEDFEKAYERFIKEYDAINVTAPFKELAFRKSDKQSRACCAIGAANILTKDGNKTSAYNSDIQGVTGAISAAGIKSGANEKALIVGCGGAAMAATYAMWNELGYDTVVINRNITKAELFVKRMIQETGCEERISHAGLDHFNELFRQSDVIIYTLPIAIPALDKLELTGLGSKVILEANYKDPAFTPEIIDRIKNMNPEIGFISGKEWLLHQAIGAYRHFVADEPDIDAMRKVIE